MLSKETADAEDRDRSEILAKKLYELIGADLMRDSKVVAKAIARLEEYRFEGRYSTQSGQLGYLTLGRK
tara:strand:+ start:419 stop:625 length:207 start_codon:yes stop_codon:yes gene_type:complete